MKKKMVHLVAAVFALLVLTFGSVALAGGATDAVKAKQATLFSLLKDGSADSQKKIAAIFDEMLDYRALAEGSLGTEWAARSDAEKAQFSDLLKQLVRKAYERNLKKILDYDVDYTGEEAQDGGTLVKTTAKSKTNAREDPIQIAFKMADKGGGAFRVQDIVTEGSSLVGSYRSQFTKIVKKDGFAALIQKMKDKLAKNDV